VITNMAPVPPFTVAIGKGVYPDLNRLPELIGTRVSRLVAFDALELAKKAGNPMALNMVLLGALIESGVLPIKPDHVKTAISSKTKAAFADINMKAFDLGFRAAGGTG
jgi:indolepyruvate ferredoxin oxidoreductase beta subunit